MSVARGSTYRDAIQSLHERSRRAINGVTGWCSSNATLLQLLLTDAHCALRILGEGGVCPAAQRKFVASINTAEENKYTGARPLQHACGTPKECSRQMKSRFVKKPRSDVAVAASRWFPTFRRIVSHSHSGPCCPLPLQRHVL